MNERVKLLVQLAISVFLILCVYLLPSLTVYSELITIITAISLTIGVILLIRSVKALARYYLKR